MLRKIQNYSILIIGGTEGGTSVIKNGKILHIVVLLCWTDILKLALFLGYIGQDMARQIKKAIKSIKESDTCKIIIKTN